MMKMVKYCYAALAIMMSLSCLSQQASNSRFSEINLKELRRTVLSNLKEDNLIESKKEEVYLFLKEDGVYLNATKFNSDRTEKYMNLLAPYQIGTGPDRTVFISKDCTAVGDFTENEFHGKMEGRLRLEYTKKKFEF